MLRKIKVLIVRVFFRALDKKIRQTRGTQTPVTFRYWFMQKVLGFNKNCYWPVHHTSIVTGYRNIDAGIDTSPGYMPGCYIQAIGKISIGDYTQISANVGLITANHDLYDNSKHIVDSIKIGKYCWVGMNSMVLPGVELGDYTIVGAGSVVTKSFPDGYCVVAGNPAKVIKKLDPSEVVLHKNETPYNGYIPHSQFSQFRKDNLNV